MKKTIKHIYHQHILAHYLHIAYAALILLTAINGYFYYFVDQPAYAAIGFVSGSTTETSSSGNSSITISRASSIIAGDFMIAHVVLTAPSRTITPPSGWTLLRRDNSSSTLASALYYKVAAASEPSSYTWSFNQSEAASAGLVAYRGVNPSTPLDVHAARMNEGGGCSVIANSVVTTQANTMLLFIAAMDDNVSLSAPSGMTERAQRDSTNTTSYIADQLLSASGSTGSKQAGCSGSSGFTNVGILVALRAAAAAPTPTITPTPGANRNIFTGVVFVDTDRDGIRDAGESGFNGAVVRENNVTNGTSITDTTDSSGNYSVEMSGTGQFCIALAAVPSGYTATTSTGPTACFTSSGTGNTTSDSFNFGIAPAVTPTRTPTPGPTSASTFTISGKVFQDSNKNGIQDVGEAAYAGTPTVTASRGTVTTSPGGLYTITGLSPGQVTVSFPGLPADYYMTYPLNGPPPSYVITVGPGCNTNGARGATCQ